LVAIAGSIAVAPWSGASPVAKAAVAGCPVVVAALVTRGI